MLAHFAAFCALRYSSGWENPGKGAPLWPEEGWILPAGDLLLRGTNPPSTGHHLLYPGQKPTEPTDASGSPWCSAVLRGFPVGGRGSSRGRALGCCARCCTRAWGPRSTRWVGSWRATRSSSPPRPCSSPSCWVPALAGTAWKRTWRACSRPSTAWPRLRATSWTAYSQWTAPSTRSTLTCRLRAAMGAWSSPPERGACWIRFIWTPY